MSRILRLALGAGASLLGMAMLAGIALMACGDVSCGVFRTSGADMAELFDRAGVKGLSPRCHMVGWTRNVACTMPAGEPAAAALAAALGLEASRPDAGAGLPARIVALCPEAAGSTAAWWIAGRPASLRLPSGSAFEFLVLHHDRARGVAMLCTSYAYG